MQTTRRTGFTLVELLVVVAIIGMLAAIVLPAVQGVKESARRVQCTANQHNVHLAIDAYEKRKGHYPGFINTMRVGSNDEGVSWVLLVLDGIGRNDLRQSFKDPSSDLEELRKTFVELLVCPSDSKSPGDSHLSYAVNGGCPVTDDATAKFDGLFYDRHNKPFIQVSSSDIVDGMNTTLMIAENVNIKTWGERDRKRNELCFLFNQRAQRDKGPIVNVEGKLSAPSSYHPGGAVVTFCGGKTHFLDDNVDESVFVTLVTPNGRRSSYKDIEKQYPLVEGEY